LNRLPFGAMGPPQVNSAAGMQNSGGNGIDYPPPHMSHHMNPGNVRAPNPTPIGTEASLRMLNVFSTRNLLQALSGNASASPLLLQAFNSGAFNNLNMAAAGGVIGHGQRSNNVNTGMGAGPKDGSSMSNMSPVPHAHSESPTAMDHSNKMLGVEDRRLPRPIGMERAHRKVPVYANNTPDMTGIWSFGSPDIPAEWLGAAGDMAGVDEGGQNILPNNYLARFGDGSLPNSSDGNGPLDQAAFQASMGGLATNYPAAFINGLPPHLLMSQLYGAGGDATGGANSAANNLLSGGGGDGHGWNAGNSGNMKMGGGGGGVSENQGGGGGGGGGGASQHGNIGHHINPEQKMMWNWSQQQR